MLTEAQESALAEINKELEAGMEDARADGFDPDTCFADIAEGFAYDIKDPEVRKEFHRRHGLVDRQTGYDPMEDD